MPSDQTSAHQFSIEVFGATDVGRARDHNEDAFVAFGSDAGILTWFDEPAHMEAPDPRFVLMVADGMGGAAAGEVASALALDSVVTAFQNAPRHADIPWTVNLAAQLLAAATLAANERVHETAVADSSLRGMGTTATIASLCGHALLLSQIGDSRAYLHRGGVATQLTRDQSLMQRLIDAGDLTPEEAERNDRRNIILQALGPEPSVALDISIQQIRDGDILILCSDGLSGQVSADDMAAIVGSTSRLSSIAQSMIAVANERGGPDNITVLLARFSGGDLLPPTSDDVAGYAPLHGAAEASIGALEHGSALDRIASSRGDSIRQLLEERRMVHEERGEPRPQRADSPHGDLASPLVFGIVAAAAAGVATILYRHFLM